jgi:hypothetical protein
VSFFFNHDIEKEEYWYQEPALQNFNDFDDKGASSPAVIIEHMTHLFTEFSAVASRYSLPQVNAGIWAMFSYGGSGSRSTCGFRLRLWKNGSAVSAPCTSCIQTMLRNQRLK